MRIRTLLVDDSPETLEALSLQYSLHQEVEVIGTAKTAAEAMTFLKSTTIDVVSIDIQLGQDNGFYLCSQIHQQYPGVFVTMCSLDDNESYRKMARASGAHYFLPKPVCADDVYNLVVHFRQFLSPSFPQENAASNDANWVDKVLLETLKSLE